MMGFRKFAMDCCVCLSNKDVIIYDVETKSGTFTYCPTCCGKTQKPNGEEGHEFEYDRSERGRYCVWCSEPVPLDYYYYDEAP